MAHTEIGKTERKGFNPDDIVKYKIEVNPKYVKGYTHRTSIKEKDWEKYAFIEIDKKTGHGRIHLDINLKKLPKWKKGFIAKIPDSVPKPVNFIETFAGWTNKKKGNVRSVASLYTISENWNISDALTIITGNDAELNRRYMVDMWGYFE